MAEYVLKLSEAELARYQLMAEVASRSEAEAWTQAGVVDGAVVVDVGCGPGAVSAVLGRRVGPSGRVIAVDVDPTAIESVQVVAERAGVANVSVRSGQAYDTGLEPGSVDVVMIRHVLAHNGGREQAIVDHAADLVAPGGCVYLADVDMTGMRYRPTDAELDDLNARYATWHALQGNDLSVGLRLKQLLGAAGLDVVDFRGRYEIVDAPPGFRSPAWAGRDALVTSGLATPADVDRWGAAFERFDALPERPTIFVSQFTAFGRRPAT